MGRLGSGPPPAACPSSPPQSRPLLPARPGLPPSETTGPQRRPGLWPGPPRARPCVLGLCLSCLPAGLHFRVSVQVLVGTSVASLLS